MRQPAKHAGIFAVTFLFAAGGMIGAGIDLPVMALVGFAAILAVAIAAQIR